MSLTCNGALAPTSIDRSRRLEQEHECPISTHSHKKYGKRSMLFFWVILNLFGAEGRRRGSKSKKAMCIKVAAQEGRVKTNVGHQGEELTYRVVNALIMREDAGVVWWPWEALPWSVEMLKATLPSLTFVQEKIAPASCQENKVVVRPIVKPPQWTSTTNHAIARRRVYAHCGLEVEKRHKDTVRIRLLERIDDLGNETTARQRRLAVCKNASTVQLQRRLAEPWRLEEVAKNAAKKAELHLDFKIIYMSSKNPGHFCDQVKLYADLDILVSIHGAHLVSVPFLPPKSLLFEILPWAHSRKKHHNRLLLNTDISYAKLCGQRPKLGLPAHYSESFCEGRTQAARSCATQARDCFPTAIKSIHSHPNLCGDHGPAFLVHDENQSSSMANSPSIHPDNFRPCVCLEHFERRLAFFFSQWRKRRSLLSSSPAVHTIIDASKTSSSSFRHDRNSHRNRKKKYTYSNTSSRRRESQIEAQ